MEVKFKKIHKDAVIPSYGKPGDAGMDLTVTSINKLKDEDGEDAFLCKYGFGLAIEIPSGYVGLLFPRSSIYKKHAILSNSVGVLDSGYRGEIMAVMHQDEDGYKVGERAIQLIIMPYPTIKPKEVDELSETERGAGGYGSTGQ